MSIKIVKGDAITALLNGEIDYLVHQTNCVGGFGSGIAGQIRKHIPEAYQSYKENYEFWTGIGKGNIPLGNISIGGKVIHLHSQLNYGRGERHTNYGAMASGFERMRAILEDMNEYTDELVIGLPYLMGCGLGGGDWEVVYELIEHCLAPSFKEVIIYKLELTMQKFFLNDVVRVKGRAGLWRVCEMRVAYPAAGGDITVCPNENKFSVGLITVRESEVTLEDAHLYPNGIHKHADMLLAYARGADIEVSAKPAVGNKFVWLCLEQPSFCKDFKYRIRPQPKPNPELVRAKRTLEDLRAAVALAEKQVKELEGTA